MTRMAQIARIAKIAHIMFVGRLVLVARVALIVLVVLAYGVSASAQAAPRIGPFVLDIQGTIPLFPNDSVQLAASRDVSLGELPGAGIGIHVAAYVYPLKWRAITFGIGGDVAAARSRQQPSELAPTLRPVTERFLSAAPQLSFNFGNGNGWSYLSGGLGRSIWSVHPEGEEPGVADTERLRTINYGGGARWFAKKHLAFSLDVRFYAIDPGTPVLSRPGGPRTTLMAVGAGVSIK